MAEPNNTVVLTITVTRANLIEALIRAGEGADELMNAEFLGTQPDDELRLWAENYFFGFEGPFGVRPNIVFI